MHVLLCMSIRESGSSGATSRTVWRPHAPCGLPTLGEVETGRKQVTQTLPAAHLWYWPKRENAVLANLELSEFCHLFSFSWFRI